MLHKGHTTSCVALHINTAPQNRLVILISRDNGLLNCAEELKTTIDLTINSVQFNLLHSLLSLSNIKTRFISIISRYKLLLTAIARHYLYDVITSSWLRWPLMSCKSLQRAPALSASRTARSIYLINIKCWIIKADCQTLKLTPTLHLVLILCRVDKFSLFRWLLPCGASGDRCSSWLLAHGVIRY